MRHTIKLAMLVPALAFLIWWGWSGNFAINSASLFTLNDLETFYRIELGLNPIGYARRQVKIDPETGHSTISEDSVINLSFSGQAFLLKTISETTFDRTGHLVSAVFNLPLGKLSGQAKATVEERTLKCQLKVADQVLLAEVPLPPAGPILVSGLIPWLANQRNIPMGRPIGLSLLDPVSMTLKPAELVIEDDTTISDELQIFKLTLKFMGAENSEWVNSQGQLLKQYNPVLEVHLTQISDNRVEEARAEMQKALSKEIAFPEGPWTAIIKNFLANDGLDSLSQAISHGGQATPWTKVAPESKVPSVTGDQNQTNEKP